MTCCLWGLHNPPSCLWAMKDALSNLFFFLLSLPWFPPPLPSGRDINGSRECYKKWQVNSSVLRRASCLTPVAVMAARMRTVISLPLLMICFSSPLKDREKGSLAVSDQSRPERQESVYSWDPWHWQAKMYGAHVQLSPKHSSFSALPMSWIGLSIFAPKAK